MRFGLGVQFGRVTSRAAPTPSPSPAPSPTPAPTSGPRWNAADKAPEITLSEGDFTATAAPVGGYYSVRATLSQSSGKRYYEWTQHGGPEAASFGGLGTAISQLFGTAVGFASQSIGYAGTFGYIANGAWDFGPYATTIDGSVVGCAIDFAGGKVWFAVNGAWQGGNPVTGAGGSAVTFAANPVFPMFGSENGKSSSCTVNLGGSAFAYAAPVGFSAWSA